MRAIPVAASRQCAKIPSQWRSIMSAACRIGASNPEVSASASVRTQRRQASKQTRTCPTVVAAYAFCVVPSASYTPSSDQRFVLQLGPAFAFLGRPGFRIYPPQTTAVFQLLACQVIRLFHPDQPAVLCNPYVPPAKLRPTPIFVEILFRESCPISPRFPLVLNLFTHYKRRRSK